MGNTPRWRKGNGSGRGPTPPDIDKIIREFQERIKNFYLVEVLQVANKLLNFNNFRFVWLASGLI